MKTWQCLARLTLVLCTALSPMLAARGPRGVFPRRVREAGRDEALFRRLKWWEVLRSGKVKLKTQGRSAC